MQVAYMLLASKMAASRRPPPESEREFLARYDASRFPHRSVAVDVVVVTALGGELRALLVRREEHPHRGRWSLPGGFVGMDESLDAAAARVLQDRGGLSKVFLEQLYTFGAPRRDPRTRVISVVYYALVHPGELPGLNGSIRPARLDVPWEGERGGPVAARDENGKKLVLAFDHADVLGVVVKRLRGKLDYAAIGFELLPRAFTLRALQEVHETILGFLPVASQTVSMPSPMVSYPA